MTDFDSVDDRERWDAWIAEAAAAVGIDPAVVDIVKIHSLTKAVAHRFERPMAPVAAFILAYALASGDKTLPELSAAIVKTLPPPGQAD